MHPEVKKYLAAADDKRRPLLHELRELILSELPGVTEGYDWGFPVYYDGDEPVSGFANRSKCVMFYLMNSAILDKHRAELGKLASGKSCIEFRESKTVSMDQLLKVSRSMLQELKKVRKMK